MQREEAFKGEFRGAGQRVGSSGMHSEHMLLMWKPLLFHFPLAI